MAVVAANGIGSGDQFGGLQRESECRRDVMELAEMLSKLNPSAEEFIPSSARIKLSADALAFHYRANTKDSSSDGSSKSQSFQYRRRRNSFNQGRRRLGERLTKAQKEDRIRRTIYVSEINQNISEDILAALFGGSCGMVQDCRVCGDPNSALRFAFVEFVDEDSARAAMCLNGFVCGYFPLKVLPSKTAIMPVNESFLPKSIAEKEMCSRTVYCTNIDKKVIQKDVKDFFELACGEICCLRLLGDNVHSTRIAFIEFAEANGANAALNCSGRFLGSLPVRVSPSKTPVRTRVPSTVS